ncbi:hypothetical protein HK102_001312, partial [Quaeritorhiza haematococci]
RDADGALIAMTPASSEGSGRNAELIIQLGVWNRAKGLGKVFDSSAGFTLPDGSVRSPDASWIARERWDRVPAEERRRFAPVVPDFVAELRSPSDPLPALRAKMAAYLAHGVRLGWLIDPEARAVEVYRPGREAEPLAAPATLSGAAVLPGFPRALKGVLDEGRPTPGRGGIVGRYGTIVNIDVGLCWVVRKRKRVGTTLPCTIAAIYMARRSKSVDILAIVSRCAKYATQWRTSVACIELWTGCVLSISNWFGFQEKRGRERGGQLSMRSKVNV